MAEQASERRVMLPAIIREEHQALPDGGPCILWVTVDLAALGVPDAWDFDGMIVDVSPAGGVAGGEVHLGLYPAAESACWDVGDLADLADLADGEAGPARRARHQGDC